MTISTTTAFKRTAGNGVTTAFSFPYHFFENGDLLVYLEAVADGTASLQVLDTDYTITGADDPGGGTVTFTSAPSSTYTVVIFRKPDLEQTVNLSSFSASQINDALDRLYEVLQYIDWNRTRSIRLPDTAASASVEIPFDRASKVLGFDSSGDLDLHDAADYDAAAALVEQATTAAYQTLHSSQNPAVSYRYSSTTTDADPGDGTFRMNSTTLGSVTAVYLDNKALSGTTVSGWVDTFDDNGKSANRGLLIIKGVVDDSAFLMATVTGSVTDGTGYRKLTVSVVSSGGTFQNGDAFSVFFVPRGADGDLTLADLASTSNGLGASLVGIEDAGGLFAADDVEAALAETAGALNTAEAAIDAIEADYLDSSDIGSTVQPYVASLPTAEIMFVIDGGGATITTGVKGYLRVPFACTITRATALADQSGSIVVDVWKDTYANYPPDNSDSITASAPVTISSATKSEDSTLTGWTTSIAAGDVLGFNVDSITTCQRVTISLRVTKT
jgi:hypothetical protein